MNTKLSAIFYLLWTCLDVASGVGAEQPAATPKPIFETRTLYAPGHFGNCYEVMGEELFRINFHEIQLAFSRDPQLRRESWKRLGERKPFIETSRLDEGLAGNYDRQQIGVFNRPVIKGDEIWFYYNGAKGRTPPYKLWPDGRIRNQKALTPAEKADFDDG